VVRAAIAGAVEDFALPYYAVQRGFFREAGLDVQVTQVAGSSAITPAIVAGSVDFGIANTGAMTSAYLRGLPLYLLLSGALYTSATPAAHCVVAKTALIRSGKDLAGKVIALNTVRDLLQAASMRWIERSGGDPATCKWYELPSIEMTAAIESGRIDAAVPVEPFYTKMKDRARLVGLPYSTVNDGKPFQLTGVICNKDWADKNPDLVRRLTRAILRTAEWANNNARAATELLADYTKIDADVLGTIPRTRWATQNDSQLVQPVIDLMAHYGFLPRSFPASNLYAGRSPL